MACSPIMSYRVCLPSFVLSLVYKMKVYVNDLNIHAHTQYPVNNVYNVLNYVLEQPLETSNT